MQQLPAVRWPTPRSGSPGSSSPPYQASALRASGDVVTSHGGLGELLELDRVDGHIGVGEERNDVVAQDDGVVATSGSPGEVGGLVQPRGVAFGRLVGPQQLHHVLTVQAVAGGERRAS